MRNIKFRGLNEKNKWSYGSLVVSETGLAAIVPEIKLFIDMPWKKLVMQSVHQVDPETIGQFVGLKDRNGVEIYEGDIVRYYDSFGMRLISKIMDIGASFAVVTSENPIPLYEFVMDYFYSGLPIPELEVIGNIHQNPELLKD